MQNMQYCRDKQMYVFVNDLHEKMFGWSKAFEETSYQFGFENMCFMKGWAITSVEEA